MFSCCPDGHKSSTFKFNKGVTRVFFPRCIIMLNAILVLHPCSVTLKEKERKSPKKAAVIISKETAVLDLKLR